MSAPPVSRNPHSSLLRKRGRVGWGLRAGIAIAALVMFTAPAPATTIERVVSPGGIEAWLVHEPAVPLIAVDFAFVGGAVQDPPGKGGTANLVASLLDEGAGDFDSKTFHDRLERKAIELGFQAERDTLRGSLRTLTENRDEAFDDLRLALTAPRFDPADVEISRAQILSMLRRATTSPNEIANLRWWQTAFAGHPYGHPVGGTLETVPAITVDDLKDYTRRTLARANLKVAVVGDIDAETVKTMLDRVFGALPAQPELKPVAAITPQGLGKTHRRQARRAAGRGDVRRPRHRAQRSGFHGRLHRQPHSRRRLVFLAALSGGAREARPCLFGLRQPGLAQSCRLVPRRHRHACRPRRGNARYHPKGNPPPGRERTDGGRTRQGQGLSQRLVRRSISIRRARSPGSWCSCSSTISALITSRGDRR